MSPRPQKYDLPAVISVENDGLAAAWCDGHFRGDREILDEARQNIQLGYEYRLFGSWVKCSPDNPIGIAAALCSYRPGRAVIHSGPQEVLDLVPVSCRPEVGEF